MKRLEAARSACDRPVAVLWATSLAAALALASYACSSDEAGAGPDGGQPPGQDAAGSQDDGKTAETDSQVAQTDGPTSIDEALTRANLNRMVTKLAADAMDGRDEGTPGGEAARAYVIAELKRCGVRPAVGNSFEQPITSGKGANILGRIEGTGAQEKTRTVLLSAHYDHLGNCGGKICNGADDNAAGVAIVIALACELAKKPPLRSVLIASWDAEEPPTFLKAGMGSLFYVSNPVVPLAQTDVAIVLDLVGADMWPGFGGHFLLGAELSPQVAAAVNDAEQPADLEALRLGLHMPENTPLGFLPWSDYHGFRQKQVPVLFLTNGQNKRYHTAADDLAGLNLDKMLLEGQYLAAIIDKLANAPISAYEAPTFEANGQAYMIDGATSETVLKAALAPGGLASTLTALSKQKLEKDLATVQTINAKLMQGASPSSADLSALRSASQRMICYAGTTYPESTCNLLP